jgi:hypothetical protein
VRLGQVYSRPHPIADYVLRRLELVEFVFSQPLNLVPLGVRREFEHENRSLDVEQTQPLMVLQRIVQIWIVDDGQPRRIEIEVGIALSAQKV